MKLILEQDPYCEHCGRLDPYDILIDDPDGNVTWCQDCYYANFERTWDTLAKFRKQSLSKKVKYYRKVLKNIEKELAKL